MFENMPQKLIRTPVDYASLEHLAWREKKSCWGIANHLHSQNYLKKPKNKFKYSLCC